MAVAMPVASGRGSETEAEENKGGKNAQGHILGGGPTIDDCRVFNGKWTGYDCDKGWGCTGWGQWHGADNGWTGGPTIDHAWAGDWSASDGWKPGWGLSGSGSASGGWNQWASWRMI